MATTHDTAEAPMKMTRLRVMPLGMSMSSSQRLMKYAAMKNAMVETTRPAIMVAGFLRGFGAAHLHRLAQVAAMAGVDVHVHQAWCAGPHARHRALHCGAELVQ